MCNTAIAFQVANPQFTVLVDYVPPVTASKDGTAVDTSATRDRDSRSRPPEAVSLGSPVQLSVRRDLDERF